MTLEQAMIEVFGQESLIYANRERISKINLPRKTREFLLNTGFPYIIDYFRFSMDLESISEDTEIGESARYLGQLFTIGCQSPTALVGRMVHLSEIGLNRNASLSDIKKRMIVLGIEEDDIIFYSEVTLSCRICINVENNGEIISIMPNNLSIFFLNSSIQQLAASLVAYGRNLFTEKDVEEGIKDFKQELKIIDPKVLDSEKNVWVDIIERLIRDREGY
ncbi:SUKH-4 family immunity protein [Phormidium nigroviride]